MKRFASVVGKEIFEIISTESDLEGAFSEEFIKSLVDITEYSPPPQQGFYADKIKGKWVFSLDAPEQPLDKAAIQRLRLEAYRMESDNLKMEADYESIAKGIDVDYSAWTEKVLEIKSRYPLPEQ